MGLSARSRALRTPTTLDHTLKAELSILKLHIGRKVGAKSIDHDTILNLAFVIQTTS